MPIKKEHVSHNLRFTLDVPVIVLEDLTISFSHNFACPLAHHHFGGHLDIIVMTQKKIYLVKTSSFKGIDHYFICAMHLVCCCFSCNTTVLQNIIINIYKA